MPQLDSYYCPHCDLYLRASGGRCGDCGGLLEPAVPIDFEEDEDLRDLTPPRGMTAPPARLHRRSAPKGRGSLGEGTWVGILLHIVGQGIILGIASSDPFGILYLFFVGATQLVYMVPAMIVFAICRRPRTVGGLGIVTGATFALNVLVFGIVCGGMRF